MFISIVLIFFSNFLYDFSYFNFFLFFYVYYVCFFRFF